METRIPGGPHIKTRVIAALGFKTNITHFLCCLRDRGHGGLSPEDLPRYRLPPAHCPIPQELLKANVSQEIGVAFLQKVNYSGGHLRMCGKSKYRHYLKILFSRLANLVTDLFPLCKSKPQWPIFRLYFKSCEPRYLCHVAVHVSKTTARPSVHTYRSQPTLVYRELFATYETYCSLRPCDGGPVSARGVAASDPSVQVILAAAPSPPGP